MDIIEFLTEYYKDAPRQGPGSPETTRQAFSFLPPLDDAARILDIGCGTGAQTLELARLSPARIVAVDRLEPFLKVLREKVNREGLGHRIIPQEGDMEALRFPGEYFDVIWSEGAIYNMGFRRGLAAWSAFLKPGGYLAVSEITWLTPDRPDEVRKYWEASYGEMDTLQGKLTVVRECGLEPVGHFILPPECWIQNYYEPAGERIQEFILRYGNDPEVRKYILEERREADFYSRFGQYYGYVFYICRKPE